MGYGRNAFGRVSRSRRGLSFVEFVGCLLALGGGVVLGSAYLGVDVKTLLVGILEQADMIEPDFLGTKVAAEEAFAMIPENGGNVDAEPGAESFQDPPSGRAVRQPTKEEQQAATELYWQGLAACIREDASHRSLAKSKANHWRLFDYLTYRQAGHLNAVKAIRAMDRLGVDERLLLHGDQLLTWNQRGARLYSRAVDQLSDSMNDQLTGPFAQTWQSAATQHRMEERLVRDKHLSVVSYLNYAFKAAAPFKPAF